MRLFAVRMTGFTGVVAVALLMVGCASRTKMAFTGPPGSVLTVDDKPHHLPAQLDLERGSAGGEPRRHPVSLVFTSQQSKEVRVKGHIDMHGYTESDVDRLVVNNLHLDEAHLVNIAAGAIVIFRGQSA